MNKFKNVRAVKFTAYFKGNGCVNFDDVKQARFLEHANIYDQEVTNNLLCAKKIFKTNEDKNGNTTYSFKFKVSSECLRHSIFEEHIPFQNPNIMAIPHVLYNAIATPEQIVRGYMYAQSGVNTLRKKSALTICDAIEEGSWRDKTTFDLHSCTGEKKKKENIEEVIIDNENTEEVAKDNKKKKKKEKSDTTLYSIENVGNITYKAEGFIDLTELQFISGDVVYDRMAVDVDGGKNEMIYLDALKRNFPSLNPKFDYYYINSNYTKDEWAERGILLDYDSVNNMVKMVLKNIMKVNINHRNASLVFDKLEINVISDNNNLSDKFEIKDNLDSFNFEYYTKYLPADENIIRANKELVAKFKKQNAKNK